MKDWKEIGASLEKLKKKDNLFILILVGILLMVITIPVDKKEGKKEEDVIVESTSTDQGTDSIEKMEQRLEKILGKIEGVGKVSVMITLKSSGEKIVEKDLESSGNSTEEADSQGGTRKTTDSSKKEETVFYSSESGSNEPYVIKEMEPEIEGVLVIAEGGDNPSVEKNISDAILALFSIDAHKIKVMKSVNE